MSEYLVTWDIELTADNLYDAAGRALEIMKDPDSIATSFEITDAHGNLFKVDCVGKG